MPSQTDCRRASRKSLRIPFVSRSVLSPSLRQVQLSGRTVLIWWDSSSLTVVFVTMPKGLRFTTAQPHSLCSLQVMGCLAQSLSVFTWTDFGNVKISIKYFELGTLFKVSGDALHVHLVALSGTKKVFRAVSSALYNGSPVHGSFHVSRSSARSATLSLVFS